jgi:hypothetical protein
MYLSLTSIFGGDRKEFDSRLLFGGGILQYQIDGHGGVGGKDGNEPRPTQSRKIYYLTSEIGVQAFVKERALVSISSLWTQILNSKKRVGQF